MELLGFIEVEGGGSVPTTAVATLGPAGTSSEQAADLLARRLTGVRGGAPVGLHDTYEGAADLVRAGGASHFVVANAYKGVNEFYMDTRLAVAGVFVMDTPLYGLARRADLVEVPQEPTICTHPSPVPLVRQLLPAGLRAGAIVTVDSTSAAARAVRDRRFDLALTTENAARSNGLEFVSKVRPIRMVWTVFVADPGERLAGRPLGEER